MFTLCITIVEYFTMGRDLSYISESFWTNDMVLYIHLCFLLLTNLHHLDLYKVSKSFMSKSKSSLNFELWSYLSLLAN